MPPRLMLGGQVCVTHACQASLQRLLCRQSLHPLVDVICSAMVLHAATQVTWRSRQKGVVRYNCADSLDRTNAASYFAAVQVRELCSPLLLSGPSSGQQPRGAELQSVSVGGKDGVILNDRSRPFLATHCLQQHSLLELYFLDLFSTSWCARLKRDIIASSSQGAGELSRWSSAITGPPLGSQGRKVPCGVKP